MKKILPFALILALLAAIGWYFSYKTYAYSDKDKAQWRDHKNIMEWLKREYHLTPDQYANIKKLHDEFRANNSELIQKMRAARKNYRDLANDKSATPEQIAAAKKEFDSVRADFRSHLKPYLVQVAAQMSPEQAQRYRAMIKEREQAHEKKND